MRLGVNSPWVWRFCTSEQRVLIAIDCFVQEYSYSRQPWKGKNSLPLRRFRDISVQRHSRAIGERRLLLTQRSKPLFLEAGGAGLSAAPKDQGF